LTLPWVRPHYSDSFDIELYDANKTYNKQDSAILVDYAERLERPEWTQQRQAEGFRIVVEHLADSDVERTSHVDQGVLTLRCPNWMWYNAAWEWSWYGVDQYQPDRNYRSAFLLQMNLQRWHRDQIIEDLAAVLPEALYSYCAQGRELPGTPPLNIPWRGYMNPEWYDSTPYSVVAESYMRSTKINVGSTYRTEVSEKIFKPMLGQQPFVVYGSVDTLRYLKREGFVTYDNLWNETYDTTLDNLERFDQVTQVVQQAVDQHNYRTFELDRETLERISHNHARLFDHARVKQGFQTEVVGNILAWWES
jgi:hypothetical protein